MRPLVSADASISSTGWVYVRPVTTDARGPQARPTTDIDVIANDYLDGLVELSPIAATYLGIAGHDEDLDDFSPAGLAAGSDLRRKTLDDLALASPVDDIDRVTQAAMRERLGLAEETYAAGLEHMSLNVLASPLQGIRDIFDLMPTDTDDQWLTFGTRMTKIPAALDGYVESLRVAAARGLVSPRRQVEACATQCTGLTAVDGYFANLLSRGDRLGGAAAEGLRDAVDRASAAYARLGAILLEEILPPAP